MKVRLHVGVATTFTVLSVLMLGLVVAFLFVSTRDLALGTAERNMAQARAASVEDISKIILETGRAAEFISSFVTAAPEQARSAAALDVLRTVIHDDGQHYGVFFGLEDDGSFYQIVNTSRDMPAFGPDKTPVPEGTAYIERIVDGQTPNRTDRLFWYNEAGERTVFSQRTGSYDPRERPWYEGVRDQDEMFVSPLYVFESTGQPGVTFSSRILDQNGALLGVAGVDLTLTHLVKILETIRIGEEGIVFMIGEEGELRSVTPTRLESEVPRFDHRTRPARDNPIVQAAIAAWQDAGSSFFHFRVGPDARRYVGSIDEIPPIFGMHPTLGFAVPVEEFVGGIVSSTFRVVQISVMVLLVAVALTFILSRLLSRDLRLATEEAMRIRNFELGDSDNLKSTIQEVSDLSGAMESMKAGLNSFGAYVPKELVRGIISSGRSVQIEGETREITILFSDLQGFTHQTEGMSPSELMPALSGYFATMEHEIAEHKGTVDKYIGDAIMALWNAPAEDPDHVANACHAALACLKAEAQMNADKDASRLLPLHTRIGLHCGDCIVGNVGSLSRMQYTALGANVNLASRLEGLNKAYGTRILVSGTLVARAGDAFTFREVDRVSPAGTTAPTAIFELVGTRIEDQMQKELQAWHSCLSLYRAWDWSAAKDAFQTHRSVASNQALVDVYLKRCDAFLTTPPEAGWDGVFRFAKK